MIEIKNLYKYYGRKCAVNAVSFTAKRGEVVGFIGPNGAGKSSTMRIITGFMSATSGEVLIDGINMAQEPQKAKQKIGYLPESAPVYPGMTVQGFLRFCAEMRGYFGDKREQVVNDALEACFLQKVRSQSIETLSKGYRHRTSLAQALLGDPEVLILDEPTDGLD
ncbi:MAG: ABC transporter ATP-binding protein, partial [Lentisphaeria bacterium]